MKSAATGGSQPDDGIARNPGNNAFWLGCYWLFRFSPRERTAPVRWLPPDQHTSSGFGEAAPRGCLVLFAPDDQEQQGAISKLAPTILPCTSPEMAGRRPGCNQLWGESGRAPVACSE